MRHLFDSKKENKSLKLVKKLQEQADLEWQTEIQKRREQELNDEAIAKELQAELEDEQRRNSSTTSPTSISPPITTTTSAPSIPHSNNLTPPPLPTKPRAYNSSISLASATSNSNHNSSQSLPTVGSSSTSLPTSVTPLYGLDNSSSHNSLPQRQSNMTPNKSYLSSQTYKPELQFALMSPTPSPTTVFYQKTPAITPATKSATIVSPKLSSNTASSSLNHQFYNNSNSNQNITRPASTPIVLEPVRNKMSMPEPVDIVSSYTRIPISSAPSSYNQQPHRQPTPISRPPPNYHNNHSDPIVQHQQQSYGTPAPTIPVATSYNNEHNNESNASFTSSYQQQNNTSFPNYQRNESSSTPISLPLSPNEILQNVFSQSNSNIVSTPTPPPIIPTNTSTTNPYYKKQQPPQQQQQQQQQPKKSVFSDSFLSLKPDEDQHNCIVEEEEEDWDNVPTKRIHTPPVPAMAISDNESDYDYSDMIYDRRKEDEPTLIEESDPFADSFAVEVPKLPTMVKTLDPTIQILDPTMLSRQLSTKTAVEEEAEKKANLKMSSQQEEKTAEEEQMKRKYEEKESEEIEPPTPFVGFKTPIQHARTQSLGGALAENNNTPRPAYGHQQLSSPAFFNHPQQSLIEEELVENKVYPTNILKAGPPVMSENNPYSKKQGAVPSSDYGYYDPVKTKTLPKVPVTTSQEDRHITVASINPGQRVWIRIHPTDTGKMLAERIHIVASYQTRKVTKITTKNGRNISLDNSPLFDDWNEIVSFKEGEAWKVEWVPIEHPYVDIITEGKEFMRQLKANFKGTSSSSS